MHHVLSTVLLSTWCKLITQLSTQEKPSLYYANIVWLANLMLMALSAKSQASAWCSVPNCAPYLGVCVCVCVLIVWNKFPHLTLRYNMHGILKYIRPLRGDFETIIHVTTSCSNYLKQNSRACADERTSLPFCENLNIYYEIDLLEGKAGLQMGCKDPGVSINVYN